MDKSEHLKKTILSLVSYFFIMLIIYYFVFPNDTFSEHITASLMTTTIYHILYHIPILLKYFKRE